MTVTSGFNLPGALAQRLRWLEARQAVLSENIANADTPRYAPRDLADPGRGRAQLALDRRSGAHLGNGSGGRFSAVDAARFETRPRGSSVSLEEEMLKIGQVQIEHQMLASLYQRSIARLRTAIGRKG